MSGSRTDRSTSGYSAATRATSAAADSAAGNASHCPAGAAQDDRLGWWPYALGLGLLGGLAVPTARYRRSRRAGGRHAAH